MTQDPFLRDVVYQRKVIDGLAAPITAAHSAHAALQVEVDHIADALRHPSNWACLRKKLVQLAAVAYRSARDLGLESDGDAISKDIPF